MEKRDPDRCQWHILGSRFFEVSTNWSHIEAEEGEYLGVIKEAL